MHDPVLDHIIRLKPQRVLEVACWYGDFTAKIAPHCGQITAIELYPELVDWCRREHSRPNVDFQCQDACHLDFPDRSFDLVFERSSLHHILDWHKVVDEMIRVSSQYVLIEEPIDDLRSPEKRNSIKGRDLLLELQSEVGPPHFKHLDPAALKRQMARQHLVIESNQIKNDETLSFDQFFHDFESFANKSHRPDYLRNRLDEYRNKIQGQRFAQNDRLFVIATKHQHS